MKELKDEIQNLKDTITTNNKKTSTSTTSNVRNKVNSFEIEERTRSLSFGKAFPVLGKPQTEINLRPQGGYSSAISRPPPMMASAMKPSVQMPTSRPTREETNFAANDVYITKVEAFREAGETIGVGPITVNQVVALHQQISGGDHSDPNQYSINEVVTGQTHKPAMIEAVKDFLAGELNFEEEDLEIQDVQYSKTLKNQRIWVRLRNKGQVAKVFSRQAKIQNKEIKIVQKFPPQAWRRLKFLETRMMLERNNDDSFRGQIRVGYDDLQPMIKRKGEYFSPISIQELLKEDIVDLPALEFFQLEPRGRKGPEKPKVTHTITPPPKSPKKIRGGDEESEEEDNQEREDHEQELKDAGQAKGEEEAIMVDNKNEKDAEKPNSPPASPVIRIGEP